MDANDIRLMCAEAAGWSFKDITGWLGYGYKDGNAVQVPDYTNDLNACAELRKLLTEEERERYATLLWKEAEKADKPWPVAIREVTAERDCVCFLRAKGLLPEKGAGE